MKAVRIILGTIILIFSAVCLVSSMLIFNLALLVFSLISLIIGIALIATSNKEKDFKDFKEFEEFKRYQEQQRQMYYRYSNAQGKPISEYLMDERTKLITYYDRLPSKFKKELADYADKLYRDYENEEYFNSNNY